MDLLWDDHFAPIWASIDLYPAGLWMTVQLVFLALALGLCLAVPLGFLRTSRNPLVWVPVWAYIYFFRGTPLLVQLFMIYYGTGQFEVIRESFLWPVLREAWWCALIAFTLNTAAYTAEIFRGAIQQTAHGEIEAAMACGMSRGQMLRSVVFPSAFRRALPAYSNEVIFMLHGSAIASTITIMDLTGVARKVYSDYYLPYEAFIAAGLFYMAITFTLVGLFKYIEKRWLAYLRPREEGAAQAAAPELR